jgi:hypothetical protein
LSLIRLFSFVFPGGLPESLVFLFGCAVLHDQLAAVGRQRRKRNLLSKVPSDPGGAVLSKPLWVEWSGVHSHARKQAGCVFRLIGVNHGVAVNRRPAVVIAFYIFHVMLFFAQRNC